MLDANGRETRFPLERAIYREKQIKEYREREKEREREREREREGGGTGYICGGVE